MKKRFFLESFLEVLSNAIVLEQFEISCWEFVELEGWRFFSREPVVLRNLICLKLHNVDLDRILSCLSTPSLVRPIALVLI
jgi:hypothetical protein